MRECGDHTLAFGRRQLRIERLALGEQMGMRIDQPRHHDFAGAVKIVVFGWLLRWLLHRIPHWLFGLPPRKEAFRLLAPETETDTPSGTEAHARHSGLITADMLEATADEHQ